MMVGRHRCTMSIAGCTRGSRDAMPGADREVALGVLGITHSTGGRPA
jgi:hypothetical protein